MHSSMIMWAASAAKPTAITKRVSSSDVQALWPPPFALAMSRCFPPDSSLMNSGIGLQLPMPYFLSISAFLTGLLW